MDRETAQKQIVKLVGEIQRHNRLYYQEDRPELTDTEYDTLFRELQELEECFPDLAPPRLSHRSGGRGAAGSIHPGETPPPHALPGKRP